MVKVLAVISPAKTLDFETEAPVANISHCRFLDQSQALIELLKKKSLDDISKLMKLSDKLTELNVSRYQQWTPEMTVQNSKSALFAFQGDVHTGLSAQTLTLDEINQSQLQLRILSGLYGLLRPFDAIQPYRLEMGTRLVSPKGKNLYEYWDGQITETLNEDISEQQADYLLNLASQEYFGAVKVKQLDVPVITPTFLDEKNGQYKIISFYAKKARGLMVRYLLEQKPTTLSELKAFNYGEYRYCANDSDELNWVFKRSL